MGIQSIRKKFESGNAIPVSQITLTREEYSRLEAQLLILVKLGSDKAEFYNPLHEIAAHKMKAIFLDQGST